MEPVSSLLFCIASRVHAIGPIADLERIDIIAERRHRASKIIAEHHGKSTCPDKRQQAPAIGIASRSGRPGRRRRHCAVVRGRCDDIRFGPFYYPAAARLYLCPASSSLDAHDANAGAHPSGSNRPIHLRVWLRLHDCRADPSIGDSLARFGGAAFLPVAVLCAVALPLAWLGFADERRS